MPHWCITLKYQSVILYMCISYMFYQQCLSDYIEHWVIVQYVHVCTCSSVGKRLCVIQRDSEGPAGTVGNSVFAAPSERSHHPGTNWKTPKHTGTFSEIPPRMISNMNAKCWTHFQPANTVYPWQLQYTKKAAGARSKKILIRQPSYRCVEQICVWKASLLCLDLFCLINADCKFEFHIYRHQISLSVTFIILVHVS